MTNYVCAWIIFLKINLICLMLMMRSLLYWANLSNNNKKRVVTTNTISTEIVLQSENESFTKIYLATELMLLPFYCSHKYLDGTSFQLIMTKKFYKFTIEANFDCGINKTFMQFEHLYLAHFKPEQHTKNPFFFHATSIVARHTHQKKKNNARVVQQ